MMLLTDFAFHFMHIKKNKMKQTTFKLSIAHIAA